MKKLNVMYISYWSLNEPLTASTILPYLELMEEDDNIGKVIFITVEHSGEGIPPDLRHLIKVEHIPIRFARYPAGPFEKGSLFLSLPRKLAKIARDRRVDVIDSKASLAGALAYKTAKKASIPFIVESFEPHSKYMLYTGVWRAFMPYYLYNSYFEKRQIEHAKYLITVTKNYHDFLVDVGVDPDRVIVVPSITSTDRFSVDPELGARIRKEEGIAENAIVGIYVGKFGGLYLDEHAFELIELARKRFSPSFHLIILTPQNTEVIKKRLVAKGFDEEGITIKLASHKEVSNYLAAADFAFSPIKYMAMSAYQSPVKNGEYWAAGLPILLTDKVSDDHWIIEKHGIGGALFDIEKDNMTQAIDQVANEMKDPDYKNKIRELAMKYRSISIAREVYRHVFNPSHYVK